MCNPPNISCWLGKCTECMSTEGLQDTLEGVFDELGVQDIIYKQWESTDRACMVTRTENVCDFLYTTDADSPSHRTSLDFSTIP